MIIGAEPTAAMSPTDRAMAALGPAPRLATQAVSPITGAIAGFILPGMIVTLVKRDDHPFIWWAFGALPLAFSAGRLVLAVGSKVEKK